MCSMSRTVAGQPRERNAEFILCFILFNCMPLGAGIRPGGTCSRGPPVLLLLRGPDPTIHMKKLPAFPNGFVVLSLLCAVFLLAAGCATTRQVQTGPSAKVVRLQGAARYITGRKAPHLVKLGDIITPGVMIQTAARSELDLALFRGRGLPQPGVAEDLVNMRQNTVLGIDTLRSIYTSTGVEEDTLLDLKAGDIYGVVRPLRGASRYEVQLPNGIVGTRGAVYDINAEGVIKVWSGSLVLSYVRPNHAVATQVIAASQQFDTRTGNLSALSEPKPELAAGKP
jgi:hypothetical protein